MNEPTLEARFDTLRQSWLSAQKKLTATRRVLQAARKMLAADEELDATLDDTDEAGRELHHERHKWMERLRDRLRHFDEAYPEAPQREAFHQGDSPRYKIGEHVYFLAGKKIEEGDIAGVVQHWEKNGLPGEFEYTINADDPDWPTRMERHVFHSEEDAREYRKKVADSWGDLFGGDL